MNGICTASNASRNATLVCVNAAGFIRMKSVLPRALMDAIDQLMLGVGLQMAQGNIQCGCLVFQSVNNLCQRRAAVLLRLTRPQQIEIGAVQKQNVKLIRHCAGISGNKTIIVENNPMLPICHLLRGKFTLRTETRSGIITIS
ncbi:Uncharacterised protein [Serratia marcescens]|uniref:Uncharacterized protein n=1 Tax=Serratia marcescens TaxID=615 RepID=A0A379YFH7_SERMA|nr:Uncharacterised protein [Serratia marcescens]